MVFENEYFAWSRREADRPETRLNLAQPPFHRHRCRESHRKQLGVSGIAVDRERQIAEYLPDVSALLGFRKHSVRIAYRSSRPRMGYTATPGVRLTSA